MSGLDELKATFFEECGELLQELESGLAAMREESASEETLHGLFRAVHSIKGGAGVFGFDGLIAFAHCFETMLDAMRRGDLVADTELVDVLFAASDVLSDLVTLARTGEAVPLGFGDSVRAALQGLIGEDMSSDENGDFDDIDFIPVQAESFAAENQAEDGTEEKVEDKSEDKAEDGIVLTVTLRPDVFDRTRDPLIVLQKLRAQGDLQLTVEISDLPSLSALQPEKCFIGWDAILRTKANDAEIGTICADFVADFGVDCVFAIAGMEVAGDSSPETAAAIPQALPETETPTETPAMAPATPAMPASVAASPPPPEKPAPTSIRVDLDKVDRAVNMVGELVIAQAMLGQAVQDLPEALSARIGQVLEEVSHHTRELKDSVMAMRAQPVKSVFQRMPRLVRELSAKTGKAARLDMTGEATEVDKTIIERLSDPLTHIIRNALDHGIETRAERLEAGKPEEGRIALSAEHRGGRIVIAIRDDGAGIDSARVLEKARVRGLIAQEANLSEDEINNLIFMPGFSTAETISDISGRGVGMDVVRRNIQDLGGRIHLKSERGRGMSIDLTLPLTLAVMDGMMVRLGAESYVLPMAAIVECLHLSASERRRLPGAGEALHLRGEIVPMVNLGDVLGLRAAPDADDQVAIVIEAGEIKLAVAADELLGHQQVVIKSIEENYAAVPGIAAATILGNGRVAFILDAEKICDLACNIVDHRPLRESAA